jgi:hypothetical protein
VSDLYRQLNQPLDDTLERAEMWMEVAETDARAAYPSGAQCIIRTKRWGHTATERVAEIVGAGVSAFSLGHKYHVGVHVNTRNLKTGKHRTYYPSCDVDGLPSVRLLEQPE